MEILLKSNQGFTPIKFKYKRNQRFRFLLELPKVVFKSKNITFNSIRLNQSFNTLSILIDFSIIDVRLFSNITSKLSFPKNIFKSSTLTIILYIKNFMLCKKWTTSRKINPKLINFPKSSFPFIGALNPKPKIRTSKLDFCLSKNQSSLIDKEENVSKTRLNL